MRSQHRLVLQKADFKYSKQPQALEKVGVTTEQKKGDSHTCLSAAFPILACVLFLLLLRVGELLGFACKHLQGWCLIVNHDFISELQIVRQMRSVNKYASVLTVPSNV